MTILSAEMPIPSDQELYRIHGTLISDRELHVKFLVLFPEIVLLRSLLTDSSTALRCEMPLFCKTVTCLPAARPRTYGHRKPCGRTRSADTETRAPVGSGRALDRLLGTRVARAGDRSGMVSRGARPPAGRAPATDALFLFSSGSWSACLCWFRASSNFRSCYCSAIPIPGTSADIFFMCTKGFLRS